MLSGAEAGAETDGSWFTCRVPFAPLVPVPKDPRRGSPASVSSWTAEGAGPGRSKPTWSPIPAAAGPSSPAAAAAEPAAPDPVRVAVLAIEGVARASMRACFTGNSIDVAAPDEATAGVLRRALAESGRATDRLVRIVVAG